MDLLKDSSNDHRRFLEIRQARHEGQTVVPSYKKLVPRIVQSYKTFVSRMFFCVVVINSFSGGYPGRILA